VLQSGDTLAGYRIESVAGVGGMGVVYRATQLSLERPVALKVLSSALVGNRTFRERFRREGCHAAALDHPNIIPVYEAGEANGLMFIAMRLVDGPTLTELISNGRLSGTEALRVVGAIASALDAAHEAGLVHRDVKPQNILLTRTGHPYLADFGITKGTDHGGLTHSGDFVGSLNYVAPEQIDGAGVTAASDVYSLAAVLFESLSGLAPYERDNDAALMLAHLQAAPPTLAARGVDAPPSLDRVFATGMAKQPSDRYTTACELVEACRAALADADPAALRATPAFATPAPPPAFLARAAPPAGADSKLVTIEPERLKRPEEPADGVAPPGTSDVVSPLEDSDSAERRAPDRARAARTRHGASPAVLAAAAVSLVVAATMAGYLLGHDEPASPPGRAASGSLSLTHDAAWSRSSVGIEGLELDRPVALRRSDGVKLVAGRMASFTPGFDPVPSALRKRSSATSAPVAVRLGSRAAVRHAVPLRSGERLWVALLPDEQGWVAIACEGLGADRAAVCPAVAGSVEVKDASGVAPGPDDGVASAISSAVATLNGVRSSARRGLRSRSRLTRARTARRVAAAHRTAATSVEKSGARPQELGPVRALRDGLRAQALNFGRLASAAESRRVSRYDAARDAIRRRERKLRSALAALREIGYAS